MRNDYPRDLRSTKPWLPGLLTLAAAFLLLFAGACGGGAGVELPAATLDTGRDVSARSPHNLLPPPDRLAPRMGNHPNAACPGDGFEEQLPHHRVSSSNGGALFQPQTSRGRGRGNSNGLYAYALYHVKAPTDTCGNEVDNDCDDHTLSLSVNPLFEGNGSSGDNPLYVGIADFDTNTWTVRATDYNSSRSNRTTCSLDIDGDDDGDDFGDHEWLVAIVVGPSSRGGGGGGGSLLLESLSVSTGWEVSLLDDGLRASSTPEGSSSLDACRSGDGAHHVAFCPGDSDLRYVRCADGSCAASSIPDSSSSGPNVGMCVSPKGSPYVCSTDSGRGVGPVRWMSPEGLWDSSLYSKGEPGEAFDPRFSSDVQVTGDGSVHVVHYNPFDSSLRCSTLTRDGEWHEETVASSVRIRQRPDLLLSEWDSLVCAFQTCGNGGAVFVYQRGAAGWKGTEIAAAPCPVAGDGAPSGSFAADLDSTGQLAVVCSTTKGDIAVLHSLRDGSTEVSSLSSPDETSRCASVVISGAVMHCFLYVESTGEVRYLRKRPGRTTYSSSTVASFPTGVARVDGHVTVLKIVLDPDDDGDGLGTLSCYILENSSSAASGDVVHWTLEVRVNRIEMA